MKKRDGRPEQLGTTFNVSGESAEWRTDPALSRGHPEATASQAVECSQARQGRFA